MQALNNTGIPTVASCCGHGKRPGNVVLADGREIILAPDFETARKVDGAFPPLWPRLGEPGYEEPLALVRLGVNRIGMKARD